MKPDEIDRKIAKIKDLVEDSMNEDEESWLKADAWLDEIGAQAKRCAELQDRINRVLGMKKYPRKVLKRYWGQSVQDAYDAGRKVYNSALKEIQAILKGEKK